MKALNHLSPALRKQLLEDIRMPSLLKHPLLQLWSEISMQTLQALCETAVAIKVYLTQEDVFAFGTLAHEAYCVMSGQLTYTQRAGCLPHLHVKRCTEVHQEAWISDAALWAEWTHVGGLVADTQCQLLVLDAKGIAEVMLTNSSISSLTTSYARSFHAQLVAAKPPFASYPTDIHVPNTDAGELLSRHVSQGRVHQALAQGLFDVSPNQIEKLEAEIANDLCSIQKSAGGDFWRVAFVSCLKLYRDEEQESFLVQVGKLHGGATLKVDCRLPAVKRPRHELLQHAAHRIIAEQLETLAGRVEFTEAERYNEFRDSIQYGMPTLYIRDVHHAFIPQCAEYELSLNMPTAFLHGVEDHACGVCGLSEFSPREVYVSPDGDTKGFYMWMDEEEFLALREPEGKRFLEVLLEDIEDRVTVEC